MVDQNQIINCVVGIMRICDCVNLCVDSAWHLAAVFDAGRGLRNLADCLYFVLSNDIV